MAEIKYVNLGCGDSFVADSSWLNLDFSPAHPAVRKADLLAKLPCSDHSVDVVYSSHFLEHIPYSKVSFFLAECYRILKNGGKIRLVVPDLEDICREYLKQREQGNHQKADFCIIELIDQCVRTKSGGRLLEYWNTLSENPGDAEMIAYVKHRTGHDVTNSTKTDQKNYLHLKLKKLTPCQIN